MYQFAALQPQETTATILLRCTPICMRRAVWSWGDGLHSAANGRVASPILESGAYSGFSSWPSRFQRSSDSAETGPDDPVVSSAVNDSDALSV